MEGRTGGGGGSPPYLLWFVPCLLFGVVTCDDLSACPVRAFSLPLPQSKTVLWRAHLDSGASVGVYTAGLDNPLKMFINLGFCRWAPIDAFTAVRSPLFATIFIFLKP